MRAFLYKWRRWIIGLVVTTAFAQVITVDNPIEIDSLNVNKGTYEIEKVLGNKEVIIKGNFTQTGGKFVMGRNSLTVKGDIFIGKDATFVPSDAPLIHAGTGHKITTITPAVYSGSQILTATGYSYSFSGYLHQEEKERIVIDPAIYSGGILVQATGSHIELYRDSLGDIEIVSFTK